MSIPQPALNLSRISLAVMLLTTWPVLAHQIELADGVGATLHIEPNDTPKAGEPSEVWFALTRRGGEIIPLADCDCTLTVYSGSQTAAETDSETDTDPLLEPTLQPVAAEGYEAIPGATFTFPAVGAYELVLAGQPQADENFEPFELRFDVVVAAGTNVPTASGGATESDTAETETPTASAASQSLDSQSQAWPWPIAAIGGGAIALLGIAGVVVLKRGSSSNA